jgi:hypothetical protein
MSRKIFCEFVEFFPKGLNTFKIQTNFKLDLFPGFYIKIHLEFEILPKRKVVPFKFILYLAKFRNFWNQGVTLFVIFKFESV